jgi:hypothetical protein
MAKKKASTKKKFSLNERDVRYKKTALNKLITQKKENQQNLLNLNDKYESMISNLNSEHLLEKLPIDSLKELHSSDKENQLTNFTQLINSKQIFRKNQEKVVDKIDQLNQKISLAEIDLTLSKINTLLEKLKE